MRQALSSTGMTILLLVSLACHGAISAETSAETVFRELYEQEWQQRLADRLGDGIPAHLPDVSATAQERRLANWRRAREVLAGIAPDHLPPERRIDYRVYTAQIDQLITAQEYREYEAPLNSSGGFWSRIAYLTRRPFHTEEDYQNYLSLLSEVPRYFQQQQDNMRSGLERGFTPARVALDGRDLTISRVAEATDPTDIVLYAPFENMPGAMSETTKIALRSHAKQIITESVIPAYAGLLSFFRDEYAPGTRQTLAASELPDGDAYYAWKIRQYTTLDQTPDEVHDIGLREVADIRAWMMDVKDAAGFDGSLAAFLDFLRTDAQFYAETPLEYLKEAAWDSKQFDNVAADYFGRLPRTRFTIQAFPPEIAPFSAGAAGGRETYWLNTYKLETRPIYSLMALTLHESAPGHSFQASIAAENGTRPDFRREVYISAFGEGWALYCEKLGIEMGLYETPYDLFGMLSYRMWRAARLVVDTGIHAGGWSRERAIQYLEDNTAIGTHEITTEVDRYISNPGQAVSYYTGLLAIEKARAEAEAALGENFNIRHFHDTVLAQGSVPLPVLKDRIDRFIAEGGPSPYDR